MTKSAAYAAFAAAVLMAVPADAALFLFDYTGDGIVASLRIEAPAAGGAITAIGGTRNGVAVTGLSSYAAADNGFTPVLPSVGYGGFSYTTAAGTAFNVFTLGTALYEANSIDNPGGTADGAYVPVSAIAPSVPEPGMWAMMIAGFAGIAATLRRRSGRGRVARAGAIHAAR